LKDRIELNSNAVMQRKEFGEDASSPIDIFAVINNTEHITLLFYPISERISGCCIRIDEEDSLIVINSNMSYGRQRYTIAHEMYHLYFQNQFRKVICGKDIESVKDAEEKNADAFASYFLAPYDAIKLYVHNELHKTEKEPLTLVDVVKIEQYFGMSRQATLYRLLNDNYITLEFANTLKSNVIQTARELGFDDKLYLPAPQEKQFLTTGSYIKLAERLKAKNSVSQGKYEELLLDAFRPDIVYNLNIEGKEKYD